MSGASEAFTAVGDRSRFAVIDYGVNNIGSVLNMLRRLEVDAVAVQRPADLDGARAIVLPGIGSFDAGVRNLRERGLFEPLRRLGEAGTPLLGICLGMQLLTRTSEEGSLSGLGLLPGATRLLRPGDRSLRIPHMGWTETRCVDADLFADLVGGDARFYYVHSYHVVCDDAADVAATCYYGGPVTAAVRRRNVFGTQFHPEKSHRFGLRVLSNFARYASRD